MQIQARSDNSEERAHASRTSLHQPTSPKTVKNRSDVKHRIVRGLAVGVASVAALALPGAPTSHAAFGDSVQIGVNCNSATHQLVDSVTTLTFTPEVYTHIAIRGRAKAYGTTTWSTWTAWAYHRTNSGNQWGLLRNNVAVGTWEFEYQYSFWDARYGTWGPVSTVRPGIFQTANPLMPVYMAEHYATYCRT